MTLTGEEEEAGLTISCPECSSEFAVPHADGLNADGDPAVIKVRPENIPVTCGGMADPKRVLGMVCFSLGTRGAMGQQFQTLKQVQLHSMKQRKQHGQISVGVGVGQMLGGLSLDGNGDLSLGGQYSGGSFRSDDLEIAFHAAITQLQLRASYLGANAVIGFRWDIDFDSNSNVINFIGTAYGTAVVI